ncbi:hypothetical protein ACOSQ3_013651 [Xanthoceras sorbifolium]
MRLSIETPSSILDSDLEVVLEELLSTSGIVKHIILSELTDLESNTLHEEVPVLAGNIVGSASSSLTRHHQADEQKCGDFVKEGWKACGLDGSVNAVMRCISSYAMAFKNWNNCFFKINSYDAFSPNNLVGLGVVIWDEDGAVLSSTMQCFDARWSLAVAEARAIIYGVLLAVDASFLLALVESDLASVINLTSAISSIR